MLLFVYGTLQRGGCSHERFCSATTSIEAAWTWGRLYDLPQGYPMLKVPWELIVEHGSSDQAGDLARLRDPIARPTASAEDKQISWQKIVGDLITLPEDAQLLADLDEWEVFQPPNRRLYDRVVLPVYLVDQAAARLAWAYVAPDGELPADAAPGTPSAISS